MAERSPYVHVLIESLQKKKAILDEIILKNQQQTEILSETNVAFDKFDSNVEAKGELIQRLTELDEGFESVYDRVKPELLANKTLYRNQIATLQSLIQEITDKSISIQTMEVRNKKKIEDYFSYTRNTMQQAKNVNEVASNYYRNMLRGGYAPASTVDQKK